ncbi:MAG: YfhO family protein, partial [Bacilli bacterium]|nr:YfhO family protein [Bacilli bacterium]
IGLIPKQINTRTLFGFGVFTDGLKQYMVFLNDFIQNIKGAISGNPLQTYRFDIGLGSDFFLNYGYYSLYDPLTIIAYLIPIKYLEFSFYLIQIIRLYLTGIFIIMLARKFNIKNEKALLVTAIFYCFNITVLYSAFRHPLFLNGPLLLPLAILGVEKVLRKESPYLLIIVAFLGLITQFYFFIYTSFGFELYLLIRLFPKLKKESFRCFLEDFIKVNLLYCLGVFLGGFVLIPQFLGTVTGGRVSSKGFVFYNAYDYLSYLLSFFVPVVGSRYSSTLGNFLIFFIILLFLFNKKKSWEKPYFLILSGMLFIPFFGYLINVGSYINNRWTYLLILPSALMIGKLIEKPEDVDERAISSAIKCFLILISLLFCFGLLSLAELSNNIYIIIIVALAVIILEYLLLKRLWKKVFKTNIKKYLNRNLLMKVIIISSFLMVLGISIMSTISLTASEGFSAYPKAEVFSEIKKDESFFRVDQNVYVLNSKYLSNDNLLYGFPATYSYNTMNNGRINEVVEFFNVVNANNTVGYNGFNERTSLNSINQVKYLLIRESEKIKVPYGFSLFQTIQLEKFDDRFNERTETGYFEYQDGEKVYEDAYIYINDNFLNFGFVYHEYIKREDLENYSYVGRENVLLEAVILEEDCDLSTFIAADINRIEPEIFILENIKLESGKIICEADGGSIAFIVNNETNAELYLEITGLEKDDIYRNYTIRYETDSSSHQETNYAYGKNFYIENPDHLLNAGYFASGDIEVRIIFEKGVYSFDKIGYYLNSLEGIDDKITSLNQESLQDLKFTTNGFSGNITLSSPGLLFLSIPYSEGFSAYVDGVETEIVQANIGYQGIYLDSGYHEVKLVYKTPGMEIGRYLSLVSLGIVILVIVFRSIKKIKENKVKNESNKNLY